MLRRVLCPRNGMSEVLCSEVKSEPPDTRSNLPEWKRWLCNELKASML